MILSGTTISIVNGTPSEKIFVIAVTYKRFQEWCRAHDINHRHPMVTYVRDGTELRGQVNAWYKDLGASFTNAQDFYEILDAYKATRGFKEIPS